MAEKDFVFADGLLAEADGGGFGGGGGEVGVMVAVAHAAIPGPAVTGVVGALVKEFGVGGALATELSVSETASRVDKRFRCADCIADICETAFSDWSDIQPSTLARRVVRSVSSASSSIVAGMVEQIMCSLARA